MSEFCSGGGIKLACQGMIQILTDRECELYVPLSLLSISPVLPCTLQLHHLILRISLTRLLAARTMQPAVRMSVFPSHGDRKSISSVRRSVWQSRFYSHDSNNGISLGRNVTTSFSSNVIISDYQLIDCESSGL
jgi:hypothetical protein